MTSEELHIWQTLAKSSDRQVSLEAGGVLSGLQQSLAAEGYYDGTWKEKHNLLNPLLKLGAK